MRTLVMLAMVSGCGGAAGQQLTDADISPDMKRDLFVSADGGSADLMPASDDMTPDTTADMTPTLADMTPTVSPPDMYGTCPSASQVFVNGACIHCGDYNEPCCNGVQPNAACTDPMNRCTTPALGYPGSGTYRCLPCGTQDGPCCDPTVAPVCGATRHCYSNQAVGPHGGVVTGMYCGG